MKQRIAVAAFLIFWTLASLTPALAEEDALSRILENPEKYDGRTVEIKGEAVGIYIRSGKGYFIQLNQDPYVERSISEGGPARGQNISIAVYLNDELFRKIRHFGDYDTKGDVICVKGVFRVSCPLHRGETDIHAEELVVLKRGYRIKHELDAGFAVLSTALFLVSVLLFLFKEAIRARYYRIINRKERM